MRRIFLCDDAADYRLLVRSVLASLDDMEVVGEACNGQECLDEVVAADPDVVLLDINMPVMDGWEALPQLRDAAPDAHVVVLSTAPERDARERALRLGAAGYIEKPISVFDLPDAIRASLPDAA
jgi:DNA-binding NarL/FixJ family response regulator